MKIKILISLLVVTLCAIAKDNPTDLDKQMFLAINDGSIASVSEYINHGADPNVRDVAGRSPLLLAFLKRNIELFDHLLKSDADPNGAAYKNGNTILYALTSPDSLPYLKIFLDFGGDLDAKQNDADFNVYIFQLAASDRIDLLELYFKSGGNIPEHDSRGRSLLQVAIDGWQFRTAFEILRAGKFDAHDLASSSIDETLKKARDSAPAPRFLYWINKVSEEIVRQKSLLKIKNGSGNN